VPAVRKPKLIKNFETKGLEMTKEDENLAKDKIRSILNISLENNNFNIILSLDNLKKILKNFLFMKIFNYLVFFVSTKLPS
jgi:hypothetical protein